MLWRRWELEEDGLGTVQGARAQGAAGFVARSTGLRQHAFDSCKTTSILASTATLPSSGTAPEEELSVEPETDSAQIVQMQHAGVDNASWEKKVDLATITVRIEARN
ncbi:hypothetical protein MCOR25_005665 [Pyricularia grisea]|nr:hypothetical protein MCOR25_005665 [Pyricularia grisea]